MVFKKGHKINLGRKQSEETIEKIRKIKTENPTKYWSGKNISKEHFNKLDKARKKYQEENKLYNQLDISKHKAFIKEKYEKGYTLMQIGEMIGVSTNTIKRNMIKWGLPRRSKYTLSSIFKADDGHSVRSGMELFADNWLFHNEINHVYEKLLGETKFRCDFYIPDTNTYIELLGLLNFKEYKENFKRKLEVYQNLGLINNLVIIIPKDKIQDKLRFLLSISKVQRGIAEYEKTS